MIIRLLFLVFVVTVFIFFTPLRAEFTVCEVRECKKPDIGVDQKQCERRFLLFIPWLDTNCVEQQAEKVQRASAEHEYCLRQRQLDITQCETLNLSREVQQEAGVIPNDDVFKENGAKCLAGSECKSGYCMPGPDLVIATSNTASKSSGTWYCASADANCALPDSNGGKYGDEFVTDEGVTLTCQKAGARRWSQFYPAK